jgi:hypothetical protein
MKVTVAKEAGNYEALVGIGLSYGITSDYDWNSDLGLEKYSSLQKIGYKLAPQNHGHNKFLESVILWLDIDAPRYWWQEFDTYRVGVTKQSESTMHTILHRTLTQADFQKLIDTATLEKLNHYISIKDFDTLKNELPEGFLQRRIVCLNYKVLRHIFRQRRSHKLLEWQIFIAEVYHKCENPGYLEDIIGGVIV